MCCEMSTDQICCDFVFPEFVPFFLTNSSRVPPLPVFFHFWLYIPTSHTLENCVEFLRRNSSINQTINPNTTSSVMEFWEWVPQRTPTSCFHVLLMATHQKLVSSAGDVRWGSPRASTTWARWTGTWPYACSSHGSCATSASGREPSQQERLVAGIGIGPFGNFFFHPHLSTRVSS